MYAVKKMREVLRAPYKHLKPGKYIITKYGKPIYKVVVEKIDTWPGSG